MSDQRTLLLLLGFGAIATGAIGIVTYNKQVAKPISDLRSEIAKEEIALESARDLMRTHGGSARELREIAKSALGDSAESVIHNLRVLLAEIAGDEGLNGVSVSSRFGGGAKSPVWSRTFGYDRKDPPDFFVVDGALEGVGTSEQAARVLERLREQEWPVRIERVSIKPTRDRSRVVLALALKTMYWPDLEIGEPALIEVITEEGDSRAASLGGLMAFNAPPAPLSASPPPPQPSPLPPPPPPAPPDYKSWAVIGIAGGAGGHELWLRKQAGGRERLLRIGDQLYAATFVGVDGFDALIEVEGVVYRIGPGERMSERGRPKDAQSE